MSIPVASELTLPEIRTRQCRFPTINYGREMALPCPLYIPAAPELISDRSWLILDKITHSGEPYGFEHAGCLFHNNYWRCLFF